MTIDGSQVASIDTAALSNGQITRAFNLNLLPASLVSELVVRKSWVADDDPQAEREGLGIIEIMGFDTNDPHGHRDAPPHIHMHLRWPYNIGTQIGHFYLRPAGLLEKTAVGITGYHLPERTFAPGQPFATLSAKGDTTFVQTIDAAGGLRIATRDNRACSIDPAGRGFDLGAIVVCGSAPPIRVDVVDDLHGRLAVRSGTIREVFRYDPDNGMLLSPVTVPPEPASAISPSFELKSLNAAAGRAQ